MSVARIKQEPHPVVEVDDDDDDEEEVDVDVDGVVIVKEEKAVRTDPVRSDPEIALLRQQVSSLQAEVQALRTTIEFQQRDCAQTEFFRGRCAHLTDSIWRAYASLRSIRSSICYNADKMTLIIENLRDTVQPLPGPPRRLVWPGVPRDANYQA